MTSDKKIVFTTDWFAVEQENFDHIDSLQGKPYYRITQPDSVVILALSENREIILIRQFRPALNRYSLEIPSGDVAKSETPQEGAARELYEETGYRCTSLTCIGNGSVLVNRFNSRIYAFLGTGATLDPRFQAEEDIRVILASPGEFREMVLSGEFDNLAMLGLLILADWKQGTGLV